MADDEVATASLLLTGVGVALQAITLLARFPATPLSLRLSVPRLKSVPVICPNCRQAFEAAEFPFEDGVRIVTCPRCWLTWAI